MSLNFTAIDFETANEQRASVCAVGLTTVRDNQIVDVQSWLVRPPGDLRFTNTHIHGIDANDVRDAHSWATTVALIDEVAEDLPLVAYNSPFDKGVHTAACTASGIDHPGHVWRDARVIAKTYLDLDEYRLVNVAEALALEHFDHHDAASDAQACAEVVLALAERTGIWTMDELWPVAAASTHRSYKPYVPLPDTNAAANPNHPLYGACITFTGELVSLTREQARAASAALGATVTAGPTRKTDVVVIGGFDPTTLRAGAATSSKHQKALDLIASGQRIELISEADLIALLAYESGR